MSNKRIQYIINNVNKFNVTDNEEALLICGSGQSNMVAQEQINPWLDDTFTGKTWLNIIKNAYIFEPILETFNMLEPTKTNRVRGATSTCYYDQLCGIAKRYMDDNPTKKIYFAKSALGGTSINSWQPEVAQPYLQQAIWSDRLYSATFFYFSQCIKRLLMEYKTVKMIFIWDLGETDAINETNANLYGSREITFFNRLRLDLNPLLGYDFPIINMIHPTTAYYNTTITARPFMDTIIAAKTTNAGSLANIYLVSRADITPFINNSVHLSPEQMVTLSERTYNCIVSNNLL